MGGIGEEKGGAEWRSYETEEREKGRLRVQGIGEGRKREQKKGLKAERRKR